MTGRRVPMSTFNRRTPPDGGEAYVDHLKRKDVKVLQYVLVAETHSPSSGTQITTVRESGTEDEARDLLRRAALED